MTVVVFPDATAVTVTHLAGELEVPVVSKVPNPRPDTFVRVRRVGGPRRDLVTDQAQLTVEAWAATDADAADLAQLARAHIHNMRGQVISGVACYRVTEMAGPANLPDPTTDHARYSLTIAVAMRGATP